MSRNNCERKRGRRGGTNEFSSVDFLLRCFHA
jgi:hypothetical protein